ncbi:prephenate dehydratase [Roseivirga echinicomitans]
MTELGLLGPENTYHDLARQKFLPGINHVLFNSFDDIFKALKEKRIKKALIAIKNSTSGLVGDNMERIKSSGHRILEQFELPIHLCLASFKASNIDEIEKIYSHPMAIKETKKFFTKYSHITFISSASTVSAIHEVKNNRERNSGVIASKAAIEANGLLLLEEDIEDQSTNSTTFALVENI